MTCGRCKNEIPEDEHEYCWYCKGFLCAKCWDEHGHCGHEEATAINEAAADRGTTQT